MPSFYGSPWMDAANAGEGFGSAIGNILTQLPALRRQAAIDAARLDLERQRVGFEGERVQLEQQKAPIENAYYRALTSGAEQKTGMEKSAQDMAGIVRQAQILKPQLLNPSLGQNQDVLSGVVNLLRGQGALPQGEVQLPRNDLAGLLDSLTKASAEQTAVSTPGTAAEMLTPREVPRGGTLVDLLTGGKTEGQPFQFAPRQSMARIGRPGDYIVGQDGAVIGQIPGSDTQSRQIEASIYKQALVDLGKPGAKFSPAYAENQRIVQQFRQGRPSAQQGAKTFKDASGTTWRYIGISADPSSDREPSHWIAQ